MQEEQDILYSKEVEDILEGYMEEIEKEAAKSQTPFDYKWRLRKDVDSMKFIKEYGFDHILGTIFKIEGTNDKEFIKYCTRDRTINFTNEFRGMFLHLIIDGYVRFEDIDGNVIPRKTELLVSGASSVDEDSNDVLNNYRIINTLDNRVIFEGIIKNEIAKKWKERKNIKVELI